MLYMLDTNICIYLMKRQDIRYFKKFESISKNNLIAISSIVLSELQYGISNSQYREKSQINLDLLLAELEVLPYTESCALYYGDIKVMLKRAGFMVGANDLFIASHALTENAILVTNNMKEFNRIEGLSVENWNFEN